MKKELLEDCSCVTAIEKWTKVQRDFNLVSKCEL